MSEAAREALQRLLETTPVASLATREPEGGAPAISLVPVVFERGPLRLYALVSELSAHTRALREEPRCALLLHAGPTADDPREQHAIARVSLAARAVFRTRDEARDEGVEGLYRARFPAMSGTLLGLGDFHFVRFEVASASLVLGFGRAFSAHGPDLEALAHRSTG